MQWNLSLADRFPPAAATIGYGGGEFISPRLDNINMVLPTLTQRVFVSSAATSQTLNPNFGRLTAMPGMLTFWRRAAGGCDKKMATNRIHAAYTWGKSMDMILRQSPTTIFRTAC
jgi:hypothetical protein